MIIKIYGIVDLVVALLLFIGNVPVPDIAKYILIIILLALNIMASDISLTASPNSVNPLRLDIGVDLGVSAGQLST